ncbi:MAG: hypothetical protein A3C16_04665 [Candidatus Sungbacteria bacterium RIFCSPHIGHO2_02_FULL_51_29]|uniref:POTRA domain-containing protein n=1 Tax=Candidatus Sungbacteria bacterium RIFCSPHIGHO2_02_FULL_51_29 TaxID=1802273 RepID=A0A1G2KRS9_9BACT|nr:MAG: hypothetical protein A3C16_04665 [Candidatus Sungbacteria bacterium RIFCSPHIGHO2_02_FULL_51_29]
MHMGAPMGMKIKRWDSDSHSSKFLFKRRLRRRRSPWSYAAWGFFIVIIFFGVGWGVRWGAHHPYFRVHTVSVAGLRGIAESEVRERVWEYLFGSIGYLIPRDNMLVISREGLAEAVRKKFPKAKEVLIEKHLPDVLAVTIRERDLWGLACSSVGGSTDETVVAEQEPMSATGGIIFDDEDSDVSAEVAPRGEARNCLLIDEEGFAFGAFEGLGVGVLPTIYAQGGGSSSGGVVVAKTYIDYFLAAREGAAKLNADLIGLVLDDANPKDYTLLFAGDWRILTPRATDPAVWISQVKTLFETELKDRTGAIEYIDLRFGNKVFYKFQQ